MHLSYVICKESNCSVKALNYKIYASSAMVTSFSCISVDRLKKCGRRVFLILITTNDILHLWLEARRKNNSYKFVPGKKEKLKKNYIEQNERDRNVCEN